MHTKTEYTHKLRIYPDGVITLIEHGHPVVIGSKQDSLDDFAIRSDELEIEKEIREPDSEYTKEQRSIRRAKDMIYQYSHANKFDMFVTGTFDKQKIDRADEEAVRKAISTYLEKHLRNKDPNAKYLLVLEYHEKGKTCLHWHALITSDYLKSQLIDSGTKTKHGQTIYNLGNYKWGFSTAVIIDNTPVDRAKVSNYVVKYMRKGISDSRHKKGKKRYWNSKNLELPETLKLMSRDSVEEILQMVGAVSISHQNVLNPYTQCFDTHYILNYIPV